MALQAFKENDELEARVRDAFISVLNLISSGENDFYNGAYTSYPLGDVLAATGDPIAKVIPLSVFRVSYPAIHMLFTRPGTFEFYLDVFRRVWGDDVDIEFTVPGAAQLEINIEALEAERNTAQARVIESDVYVRYDLETQDGDGLVFLGTRGLQTQRQAETLVRELSPDGIFITTTLSIS